MRHFQKLNLNYKLMHIYIHIYIHIHKMLNIFWMQQIRPYVCLVSCFTYAYLVLEEITRFFD
jgi:hypothetical protein